MKIRLSSICNAPDCPGGPGDIVDAPDELARRLIDGRAAVAVEDDAPVTPRPEEPAEEPEKLTAKRKKV